MIKGGVEHLETLLVLGFHLDSAQLAVPSLFCLIPDLVEVVVGKLLLVLDGALDVHGRDGHLEHHRCHILVEIDDGFAVAAAHIVLLHQLVIAIELDFLERLGGEEREIAVLVGVPGFRAAETIYLRPVVGHTGDKGQIPVTEVDDDALAGGLLGEGIAVHAHALAGGELGENAIVKLYSIVTGRGLLVVVGEGARILAVADRRGAREGHHEDVTVVAAARAAEVGVRETVDAVVAVMVAGAAVPALQTGVGTDLHSTEGHEGPWEGVSVLGGTHQRIHVFALGVGGESECQKEQYPEKVCSFHNIKI